MSKSKLYINSDDFIIELKILERYINSVIDTYPNSLKAINEIGKYIKNFELEITKQLVKIDNNQNKKDNLNKELLQDFEELWSVYPKKLGKKQAFKHYSHESKTNKNLYQDLLIAIENYKKYIKENNIEPRYIKNGSTFFYNYQDYLNIETNSFEDIKDNNKKILDDMFKGGI